MPPPPILLGTHEPFGYSEDTPHRVPFTLDPAQHTYVIGASGSGKTHLLRNILIQMIARGDGVGFLDPHGDTAEELLDHIPPERTRDVCYFNPADVRFPLAWNPLASVPRDRQDIVIEDIVAAFRNLHTPSDLVVNEGGADVGSSSALDFLLLPTLSRVSSPDETSNNFSNINGLKFYH